jgi:hypothetical protein
MLTEDEFHGINERIDRIGELVAALNERMKENARELDKLA